VPAARVIARLDVKGPNLVKGIRLEGLRVIGDPREHARRYYADGADEILYVDIVASLYGRNNILDVVRRTAEDVFVPLTVAGGLRSVADVHAALRSGADKVAINTAAVARPALIREVAEAFGSQCMVASIQAKRTAPGRWEAYTDNGRERTGRDALAWAAEVVALGAGELLVTSVDHEGVQKGMDLELIRAITAHTAVPVIAGGGVGAPEHARQALVEAGADAVAVASVLHYRRHSIGDLKAHAALSGMPVRGSA
jgi:cyclase